MNQGSRMDRLAEVAEARTHRLVATQNAHRQVREQAEAQLEALRSYRADYAARFDAAGRDWDGRAIEDYRRFLERLDRAIREQDDLVRAATQRQDRSAESVQESWRAARAMGRLAERVSGERRRLEARQAQRADDELAAQIARKGA